MKKVFLSGPIRGLSRTDSLGWRDDAGRLLRDEFVTTHALRGREEKETLPDRRIAIHRDKDDILRADIMLVNDTFGSASMIGTAMEIIFAHEHGKLVVLFGDAHANDYWMDYHSYVRFGTLEEACSFLKTHYHG
jgi:hypothetical protein